MKRQMVKKTFLFSGWLCGIMLPGIGCSIAERSQDIEVEHREWSSELGFEGSQLLTEHYDLRVTVKDSMLLEYAPVFIEATYREYRKLMPPPQEKEGRQVVYVFDNRPEWVIFTRQFAHPSQVETYMHIHSGGYMDHLRAVSVFWDVGRDNTLSLMAHECWHQYLAFYFPEPLTAWLNEGMACQWESFDLQGREPIYQPARNHLRRSDLRDALLEGNELIPLDELLGMNPGYAVTQTGATVRNYYAQVWSLVLFLRQSESPYHQGFLDLLADAGTERIDHAVRAYRAVHGDETLSEGEIIFRHYITDNLPDFESEYRNYCRSVLY